MRQEIQLDQAIGKRIEGWASDIGGQFVLTFDDGTFTTLEVDRGHDGDASINGARINFDTFSQSELVRIGVATLEELEAMSAERDRKWRADRDAAERDLFERLRKKFGP